MVAGVADARHRVLGDDHSARDVGRGVLREVRQHRDGAHVDVLVGDEPGGVVDHGERLGAGDAGAERCVQPRLVGAEQAGHPRPRGEDVGDDRQAEPVDVRGDQHGGLPPRPQLDRQGAQDLVAADGFVDDEHVVGVVGAVARQPVVEVLVGHAQRLSPQRRYRSWAMPNWSSTLPDGVIDEVVDGAGLVVEGRHRRQHHGTSLRHRDHVAEVDEAERGLPRHEHQAPPLLQRHVGGSAEQLAADPVGDRAEGPHRARHHGHADRGERARGDRCGEVVGVVHLVGQRLDLVGRQVHLVLQGRAGTVGEDEMGLDGPEPPQRAEQRDAVVRAARSGDAHHQAPRHRDDGSLASLAHTDTGPAEPAARRDSASSTLAGGAVPSIPTSLAMLLPM